MMNVLDPVEAAEGIATRRMIDALRDPIAVARRRRPTLEITEHESVREYVTATGYRRERTVRLVAEWKRIEGPHDVYRFVHGVGTDPTPEQLLEAKKNVARAVYFEEEMNDRLRRIRR